MLINAKCPVNYAGEFKLKVVNATGKVRMQTSFTNVICNEGLNELANDQSVAQLTGRCLIGTNNSIPSFNDTYATFSNIVSTSISRSTAYGTDSTNTPPEYTWYEKELEFSAGVLTGLDLVEIGMGTLSKAFCRTLIKDANGNPLTINLTADEYLYVTWRVYRYLPLVDYTGTFVINIDGTPETFDYTMRPLNMQINSTIGWFSAANKVMHRTALQAVNATELVASYNETIASGLLSSLGTYHDTYVPGQHSRQIKYQCPPDSCNIVGGTPIWATELYTSGWQFKFVKQGTPDPVFGTNIPKDATRSMELILEFTYGRYDNYGILQSTSSSITGAGTVIAA